MRFQKDLEYGKKVEAIVKAHLEERGIEVFDYSESPVWQFIDVDFCIIDKSGNRAKLEVKGDKGGMQKYGNVFIEDQNGNSQGWRHYCEADYICFYDTEWEKGYIVDWNYIKNRVLDLGKEKVFFDKIEQRYIQRKGYVIPLSTLKSEDAIVYEWSDSFNWE